MAIRDGLRAIRTFIDGDLTQLGGPAVPDDIAGRFRAAQIAAIVRFTQPLMLANIFNACILVLAFWERPKVGIAIGWAFCLMSAALYLYLRQRARGPQKRGGTASRRAIHATVRNGALLGLLWSVPPLVLFADAAPGGQIIILAITIGILCGGAFALASVPAAGLAFLTPLMMSSAIALTQVNERAYWLVSGLLIAYAVVLMRAMIVFATQLAQRFVAEIENESAARTDALTLLPNRSAFAERLDEVTSRAKRFGEAHAVFFLDLDRFKEINDTFGHAGGDEFLVEVARRLQICVHEGDIIARISGDEFAIIGMGIANAEQAAGVARRIQHLFDLPFSLQGKSIAASTTIGIALLPFDGQDSQEILARADEALYAGKRHRRGSFRFCDESTGQQVSRRKQIVHDLQSALANREFHLAFQPINSLATGATTGFEALLRWRHPERGLVSPSEFVPIAEEAGLIHEIGEWVIRSAIMQAAEWPEPLRVSINVSAAQFRTLEIADIIEKAIAVAGIAPHRVEIEITESMIISDLDRTQHALQRLRRLGVGIALDDFGTGYSSLIHLVRLPIDRIKIDQYFVGRCLQSAECAMIVRAIVRLASEFGLSVIAEGIETEEQLKFIRSMGCAEAQGFLFGIPGDSIARERPRDGLQVVRAA